MRESAPYETLRVLRAFVVNPTFLILVAALPRWDLRGDKLFDPGFKIEDKATAYVDLPASRQVDAERLKAKFEKCPLFVTRQDFRLTV